MRTVVNRVYGLAGFSHLPVPGFEKFPVALPGLSDKETVEIAVQSGGQFSGAFQADGTLVVFHL